jgi:hypothetical protein
MYSICRDHGWATRIEGANPAASYSGEVDLKAGNTIDVAVGYGKNKAHFCDATGLLAKIRLVSRTSIWS